MPAKKTPKPAAVAAPAKHVTIKATKKPAAMSADAARKEIAQLVEVQSVLECAMREAYQLSNDYAAEVVAIKIHLLCAMKAVWAAKGIPLDDANVAEFLKAAGVSDYRARLTIDRWA